MLRIDGGDRLAYVLDQLVAQGIVTRAQLAAIEEERARAEAELLRGLMAIGWRTYDETPPPNAASRVRATIGGAAETPEEAARKSVQGDYMRLSRLLDVEFRDAFRLAYVQAGGPKQKKETAAQKMARVQAKRAVVESWRRRFISGNAA